MNIKAMVWLCIAVATSCVIIVVYSWFLESIIFLALACLAGLYALLSAERQQDKKRR
jgi:hypothetical protein